MRLVPDRNARAFGLMAAIVLFSTVSLKAQEPNKEPKRELPIQELFAKKTPSVEAVADSLEYQKDQKKVIGKGSVVLTYENLKVTADYAEVETDTKKSYTRGHVIFFEDEEPIAKGEEFFYDFNNRSGSFPKGRFISTPKDKRTYTLKVEEGFQHASWFATGDDIQMMKDTTVVKDGAVTTCNLENPHYEVRAKKVTIHSEDKLIAKNVTIYALGKPIFWWPYLVIPLQRRNSPITLTAGYNSEYGAYIETSKGMSVNKNISGELHADWRAKRGVGGGVDADYNFKPYKKRTVGFIKTYLTQDERAPTAGGLNPYGEREDRERGRVTWLHRTDWDRYSNAQFRYNRLADEYFLQDFFEKEFRSEVEPQSFVTLTKNSGRFGFLTHVEKKMNTFESLVERLPEVRFNWKNQPFFHPRVYYENRVSYSNLAKRFRRSDYNEDVNRGDWWNEWSVPLQWNDFKLTPYTNVRGTIYSRERESPDDKFRATYGHGADLRAHFYKTYPISFDKIGIEVNHLRHLIEPSVRFDSVLFNTVSDEQLNHFDSVDTIDNRDIVTLGVENRIQTKRVIKGRMQRVDLVSLNTFLSYEVHPDGQARATSFAPIQDGKTASNFTIYSQEIVVRPYEWLQSEARFDFDLKEGNFRVFNDDIVLNLRQVRIIFGHRFTNDIGDARGSNQFVFEGSWVINPLWQVGGHIRWDAEREDLQEWQISATRDLHDFILDFGYNVRNSAIASSNKELFFNFRLKAFPEYAIRGGRRASFGAPRIGETVAGANQG